jgi:hypothetical protein
MLKIYAFASLKKKDSLVFDNSVSYIKRIHLYDENLKLKPLSNTCTHTHTHKHTHIQTYTHARTSDITFISY